MGTTMIRAVAYIVHDACYLSFGIYRRHFEWAFYEYRTWSNFAYSFHSYMLGNGMIKNKIVKSHAATQVDNRSFEFGCLVLRERYVRR